MHVVCHSLLLLMMTAPFALAQNGHRISFSDIEPAGDGQRGHRITFSDNDFADTDRVVLPDSLGSATALPSKLGQMAATPTPTPPTPTPPTPTPPTPTRPTPHDTGDRVGVARQAPDGGRFEYTSNKGTNDWTLRHTFPTKPSGKAERGRRRRDVVTADAADARGGNDLLASLDRSPDVPDEIVNDPNLRAQLAVLNDFREHILPGITEDEPDAATRREWCQAWSFFNECRENEGMREYCPHQCNLVEQRLFATSQTKIMDLTVLAVQKGVKQLDFSGEPRRIACE